LLQLVLFGLQTKQVGECGISKIALEKASFLLVQRTKCVIHRGLVYLFFGPFGLVIFRGVLAAASILRMGDSMPLEEPVFGRPVPRRKALLHGGP
jgi:hypothetical protein